MSLFYEFNIRKVVYKPSHETLEQTAHWVNKIEKEINKRLIEHPDWVSVYDEKTGNTQMVLTKDLDKDEKRQLHNR